MTRELKQMLVEESNYPLPNFWIAHSHLDIAFILLQYVLYAIWMNSLSGKWKNLNSYGIFVHE